MPAKPLGDLPDARLGLAKPKYQTPFIKGEAVVLLSHRKILPTAN
jgi:hypothetical protein